MVFDTSLTTATAPHSRTLLEQPQRGHLVESAVGTYLLAQSKMQGFDVFWWREDNDEVDFVVRKDSLIVEYVKVRTVKNSA